MKTNRVMNEALLATVTAALSLLAVCHAATPPPMFGTTNAFYALKQVIFDHHLLSRWQFESTRGKTNKDKP